MSQSESKVQTADEEGSDSVSSSSTVIYDQEPFETFRVRVLDFARSTWPEVSPNDITVERMAGGGFNRIIGISIALFSLGDKVRHLQETKQYILRVPRFDAARLDREVAALLFIRQNTRIPVPEVVAFDGTDKNLLGSPYMLQNRISGCDLYTCFHDLDHQYKCRIAQEFGRIFNRMLSIRGHSAGVLVLPPEDKSLEAVIHVTSFLDKESMPPAVPIDLAQEVATRDQLLEYLADRRADGLKRYPSDQLRPTIMDRFITMTQELEADGWFTDNWVCLCHLDLAPRNILICTEPNVNAPKSAIAGILDWDSAVLAPSFLSCAPPLWLWAWNDEEAEDEHTANDVPPTKEGQEPKRIFEEAAGPDYVRFAYPSAYRLARRLVSFAIDGIRSSEDVDEAEAMLQQWKETRQASFESRMRLKSSAVMCS